MTCQTPKTWPFITTWFWLCGRKSWWNAIRITWWKTVPSRSWTSSRGAWCRTAVIRTDYTRLLKPRRACRWWRRTEPTLPLLFRTFSINMRRNPEWPAPPWLRKKNSAIFTVWMWLLSRQTARWFVWITKMRYIRPWMKSTVPLSTKSKRYTQKDSRSLSALRISKHPKLCPPC